MYCKELNSENFAPKKFVDYYRLKSQKYVMILFAVVGPSPSIMSDSLPPRGSKPARLFCPWDFPGKNTGVGCHFLLQGIFLTQGSNPHVQSFYNVTDVIKELSVCGYENVWVCMWLQEWATGEITRSTSSRRHRIFPGRKGGG